MSLARLARASRRHLPAVVAPSLLWRAPTAAPVHELERVPSLAPLQRCLSSSSRRPLGQLGGARSPAPLRQFERFLSAGGKKCPSKEYVTLVNKVAGAADDLANEFSITKNLGMLYLSVMLAALVTFPVSVVSMMKDKAKLKAKLDKVQAELKMVQEELARDRLAVLELKKFVAKLLAKVPATDDQEAQPSSDT